jgi:hypothetical protein
MASNTDKSVTQEHLLAVLRALVGDIEAMQDTKMPDWFGPFGEYDEPTRNGGVAVEWPNLRISLERAQALSAQAAERGE